MTVNGGIYTLDSGLMLDMSDRDLGWLAGILEGEGCFAMAWDLRRKRRQVQVRVCMTDEDVVRRCQSISGLGTLTPQKPSTAWNKPHHKPIWRWYVGRATDIHDLLTLVYPLMGARRQERIAECLALVKNVVPAEERTHCPHGHPYSGENLIVNERGHRKCRACITARQRASYHRDKPATTGIPHGERTHCPNGHPYEGENLILERNGARRCRTCRRARTRRYQEASNK